MRALWIEERDKPVWHRSIGRTGPKTYRAACGWRLPITGVRLWPGRGDDGPDASERCHSCVAQSN